MYVYSIADDKPLAKGASQRPRPNRVAQLDDKPPVLSLSPFILDALAF